MIRPASLAKGSRVALVAPARFIKTEDIEESLRWLKVKGLEAVFDERLFRHFNQYGGISYSSKVEITQIL